MAFTVEPQGADTIDIFNLQKHAKDYEVDFQKKFIATEQVEKIIVLDPLKDTMVQINAAGQAYTLDSTQHPGEGITDIKDIGLPWINLLTAETKDFQTGKGEENRGILAIRIKSDAPLTADFHIFVSQRAANESEI